MVHLPEKRGTRYAAIKICYHRHSGSLKDTENVNPLSDDQLLKKDFAPCSEF